MAESATERKMTTTPPVVLFGYASSPFTNKVRLVLRLKGIEYTYVPVPSMPPRPLLLSTFSLPYRKIPVLALGPEIYCDTSLIIEALEHYFPESAGYASIYPRALLGGNSSSGWNYRGMARGLASYWFDRPLFRTTTGLIPQRVWETDFGRDRGKLIGHRLDAGKLGAKIPQNLSSLDLHLSMVESTFMSNGSGSREGTGSGTGNEGWIFPTERPSLVDIALWYQVKWGWDIGSGRGVYNLSGGGTSDGDEDVVFTIFNQTRYPGTWSWFHRFEKYVSNLPAVEREIDGEENTSWKDELRSYGFRKDEDMMVPTSAGPHELDVQRGLKKDVLVEVRPDDTGRDDPMVGVLVGLGVEEVVVRPMEGGDVNCRVHFPRLGFVVKAMDESRL